MISISTGTLYCYGLERIFRIANSAGYKNIELFLRKDTDTGFMDCLDVNYLRYLEKKYKIKIVSIHPSLNFDENPEGEFRKIILLSGKIEAKNIIFHIPSKEWTGNIKWFKEFYLKNLNYNHATFFTENTGEKSINDTVSYFKTFPNFCFDIGHAMRSGIDVEKAIESLTNIRQFHVHNFDGKKCHRSILKNKKFFEKIFTINKSAIKCVEGPRMFKDLYDENEVIKVLEDTRKFLEKFEK